MNSRLHHLRIVLATCAVMTACCCPASQATDSTKTPSMWTVIGDDLSTSVEDAAVIFSKPVHYTVDNWLDFGSVLIGTVAIMPTDSTGRAWVKQNNVTSGLLDDVQAANRINNIANVGRWYGEATVAAGLSGATYIGGLAFKNDKIRVTGRMMFEALLFSGAVTTVLKSVIGRSRPYTDDGPWKYRGLQFNTEHTSLPSGHSTVAFAMSSVLAARIDNPIGYFVCYGLATLTAGSRVWHDKHWLSDTFLGAAIGGTIGFAVAHLHDEAPPAGGSSWRLTPTLSGISLVGLF